MNVDADNAFITTAILWDMERYTSYNEKQRNMYVNWFYFNYEIIEATSQSTTNKM